jgi:hypothetical protein
MPDAAKAETWEWRSLQETNEVPEGQGCSRPECACRSHRTEEVREEEDADDGCDGSEACCQEEEELAHLMTEEELAYFQNFNILVTDEEEPVYWAT